MAKKCGAWVVEDACHAFSPYFKLRGHMACFSFHPAKHITTGEGGAVVTNDETLYNTLIALRDHGRNLNIVGYNYRLPDINCALGLSQLKKLGQWQLKRLNIAYLYGKALKSIVQTPDHIGHAFHLYIIRVSERDSVRESLRSYGVGTQIHYRPVYCHPFYKYGYYNCPEAERYYEECLSLPVYPTMTDREVEYVIQSVKEVLR